MIHKLFIKRVSTKKRASQLFLWFGLLFSSILLNAQNTPSQKLVIQASHIVYDGKIILRWVPANYETWKWCNEYGYTVERYTIETNGVANSKADEINSLVIIENHLQPLSENEFESAAQNNPMMGVAGAALYSTDFNVTTGSQDPGWVTAQNAIAEKENRYGYSLYAADQNSEVARAMALLTFDNNFSLGNKYKYIIKPYADPNDERVPTDRAIVLVDPNETFIIPVIQTFEGEGADLVARLRWRKDGLDKFFNSYIIEKSEYLAGPYTALQGANIVSMSNDKEDAYLYFNDVLEENKKPYFYRIVGHSPFGLLSNPSAPVEVIGKASALEGAQPLIRESKEISPGVIRISWDFPASKIAKIKGFDIYRSETVDGTYLKINAQRIDKMLNQYDDATLQSAAYYIVKTIDENDYEIPSLAVLGQLHDEIPPLKPTAITCSTTKEGHVTIEWAKNSETDLKGYRVFFSNDKNALFAQLTATPVTENRFEYDIETNVLNEMVYYKVFALDYHENNSEYSAVCEMKRPDIIPPSAPVLFQALPTYDGVKLKWYKSSSADVQRHELQRKISFNVDWEKLNTTSPEEYTDIATNSNYYYDYRILAFDDDNNVSSSDILQVRPIYDGITKAVGDAAFVAPVPLIKMNINVLKYFKPDFVDISWKYLNGSTTEKFVLYRSGPNGGSRRALKEFTVNSTTTMFSFQDSKVERGKFYVYEVEICTDGLGCQPFGERQPVFFRPKGGNKESTGGFTSTSHSNEYNKQKFPYKKPLVHFDMGGNLNLNEMLEIYAAPLEAPPIIKTRIDANDARWFWQDLSPASEALYQFKVCDTETGLCRWSEMQTFVQFYPEPGYSVFHNYLPNYVQVQFTCDGPPPPGAYYQITKSLSKNGGAIKSWRIEAPNVPNGDCHLPTEDKDVKLDTTYYYNIYFVNNGNISIIKENIEVKY